MELVVLSGKGGTGKTTIAASLCELNSETVRIDCDVDAPNMYMMCTGKEIKHDIFYNNKAFIDSNKCIKCGKCEKVCRFDAIHDFKVDELSCESCGTCMIVCPEKAISFKEEKAADMYVESLDSGILSRAQLEVGSDGSGKLINKIRRNAKENMINENNLIICDGSPGIGCSVISSVTGSDAVLIVTEPTKSGLNDLKRVVDLCNHFGVIIMVCINKYDINKEMSTTIENFINERNLKLIGKIPYDNMVMKSVNELRPIINYKDSIAGREIINMWSKIKKYLNIN